MEHISPEGKADIDSLVFKTAAPKKPLQANGMRLWLRQYAVNTRSSTVTNAFVAALLPHDKYDLLAVKQAMVKLGQDPEKLSCVYCGAIPTTWDHLTNLVQDRKANGPGHRVYNLVPCCSACNSSKGGATFEDWIRGYTHDTKGPIPGTQRVSNDRREQLVQLLIDYQKQCPQRSAEDLELEAELMTLRDRVLAIFKEADQLVVKARPKS